MNHATQRESDVCYDFGFIQSILQRGIFRDLSHNNQNWHILTLFFYAKVKNSSVLIDFSEKLVDQNYEYIPKVRILLQLKKQQLMVVSTIKYANLRPNKYIPTTFDPHSTSNIATTPQFFFVVYTLHTKN